MMIRNIQIRAVALPKEHGGWGILGEAALLGIILTPTLNGLLLIVFAAGAFLLYFPARIFVQDKRAGQTYTRTIWAGRFAILYAVITAGALSGVFMISKTFFWLPLAAAVPLVVLRTPYVLRKDDKSLPPELLGSLALGSVAASILIAGGWNIIPALRAWLILSARGVTSVIYIRHRLRKERKQACSKGNVFAVHLLGLTVLWALASHLLIPWPAVWGFGILSARAVYGMSFTSVHPQRPQAIGIQEMAFGIVNVLFISAGYF